MEMERNTFNIPKNLLKEAKRLWDFLEEKDKLPLEIRTHRKSKNALVVAALILFCKEYAKVVYRIQLEEAYSDPEILND